MWHAIKEFFEKYEKHISSLVLVGGFALDNFTLRRIDLWWDDALLITYLVIAGVSLVCVNLYDGGRIRNKFFENAHPWFMFAMQFVLGGLFSASFIFYSRSATFAASWPFLLLIFVYLLGNEFLKKHYARLGAQLLAYFMALFSFMIFFVPVVLHQMGDKIFLLSGALSVLVIAIFVHFLLLTVPDHIKESRKIVFRGVFGIFCVINILYFTNIIPPVPLSLKEAGVYRSVIKNPDGTYALDGEKKDFWNFFHSEQVLKIGAGEPVYLFSSVFAPTQLNTRIVHLWQYYDESKKEWVNKSRIPLSIFGGRDGGYHTYSIKGNIIPGLWRVDIETERGQIIGREEFKIEFSN